MPIPLISLDTFSFPWLQGQLSTISLTTAGKDLKKSKLKILDAFTPANNEQYSVHCKPMKQNGINMYKHRQWVSLVRQSCWTVDLYVTPCWTTIEKNPAKATQTSTHQHSPDLWARLWHSLSILLGWKGEFHPNPTEWTVRISLPLS